MSIDNRDYLVFNFAIFLPENNPESSKQKDEHKNQVLSVIKNVHISKKNNYIKKKHEQMSICDFEVCSPNPAPILPPALFFRGAIEP